MKRLIASLAFLATTTASASAQQSGSADAIFNRARQLVVAGNGSAGRLLIDSVLSATPADSPVYGDALYWRGVFDVTSAEAERDFTRVTIEFPFSAHAGEALYQLAQIQSGRGARADAARNLERFLLENPKSADRTKAQLQLVRLWFDQNNLPRGCTVLKTALAETPETAVEQRNQLDYYSPRCMANDVGPGGRTPPPVVAAMPSAHDSVAPKPAREEARFTLQVAAYKSKTEADALAKKLKARKLDARVVPSGKTYRVRIGRYATRSAALAEQKTLKAKKIDAFITEIGADDK